ncbi:TetR/AcrR family transcriptional regulator [Lusitaniella coriacea LEGE 07157]|uniref:TetR/AcrR family transcriptional regulator n=1 Tax=Lusitaniella coriacea LEGE 07157 TaxID=945747 RepID=A0A8J7DVV1_9CYAN|nr:TetR/AcrR family transcriptional regulator [Lusitaniella coriacea]MBE9116064.1 TetR/AcrR family transcriptional regulator [Lusitaniella coriacea LEGE 07157]
MPRNKTISNEEILAVARKLFFQEGVNASTRKIAKQAGISEAVIYQRFGTKEDFFFSAMKLPEAQLDEIFRLKIGEGKVVENLERISLGIVNYFREVMPVFLTLISHPSFSMPTFLERHSIPATQLSEKLIDYLTGESKLGRVRGNNSAIAVDVLLSYLHNIALYETLDAPQAKIERSVADAIALLWDGLAP